MENIENKLEILRKWFINNHEYSLINAQLLKQKYDEILFLLKEGAALGMRIYGINDTSYRISYLSVYEILLSQQGRVSKIQKPDAIILTSENKTPIEVLYNNVCSAIVVQMAKPLKEIQL